MTINEATISDGQSRRAFEYREKDDYFEAWEDHFNDSIVIVGITGQKRGTLAGKKSLTSISDSYPQSMGMSLFEDSDLPDPTVGTGFKPEIFTRYMLGRLRWTWAVELLARGGQRGAWKAPRAEDSKQGRITFNLNAARKHYLGTVDILGTVSDGTDDDDPVLYGRDGRSEALSSRWKFGKHYIRKNMRIQLVAPSGGAVDAYGPMIGTARNVDGFDLSDPDAPVLDLSGDPGDVEQYTLIIPAGSRRNTDNTDADDFDSDFASINGLLAGLIVDESYKEYTLNVSRSSYPTMNGWVFAGETPGDLRAFGEAFIEIADDTITDEGPGDDADVFLCHKSMRREYLREVKGMRMFGEILAKRGYAANLVFQAGDTPLKIVTDRDCPPGLIFLINSDSHGSFVEAEMQQIDEGERFVDNKASHEIVIGRSFNNACKMPQSNAVIGDFLFAVADLAPA